MSRLQSVQNAATRLITGVRWCKHITSALRQLHCRLPVRRRIDLNISTLVYLSSAGTAPVYLADECTLVTAVGRRRLRSANNRTYEVKRSHNQFSNRCFATAGPTLWKNLPRTAFATGHLLRTVSTIAENVYVWLAVPRRTVSER